MSSIESSFSPGPDGAFSGLGYIFTKDPSREELQLLIGDYGYDAVVELCNEYRFPLEGQSTDVGDDTLAGDIEAARKRRAALNALLNELKPTEDPATI